jgi:hypothetical protein
MVSAAILALCVIGCSAGKSATNLASTEKLAMREVERLLAEVKGTETDAPLRSAMLFITLEAADREKSHGKEESAGWMLTYLAGRSPREVIDAAERDGYSLAGHFRKAAEKMP